MSKIAALLKISKLCSACWAFWAIAEFLSKEVTGPAHGWVAGQSDVLIAQLQLQPLGPFSTNYFHLRLKCKLMKVTDSSV